MSQRFVSIPFLVVLGALLACKQDKPKVEARSGSSGNVPSGGVEVQGERGSVRVSSGKGVGEVGVSTDECEAGKPCKCEGLGACNRTCVGGGCQFECHGIGACNFHCPDGKCTAKSDATGATNLHCAGGGCRLECSGVGACNCATGCQ